MQGIERIGRYLTAQEVPGAGYTVEDRSGSVLALVEWYPRWKRWVLAYTDEHAVFSADCLRALATFLETRGKP